MARKKTFPLIEDFNNIPEEVLVPEEERPYVIPKHWKWVRLGAVAEVIKEQTDNFSKESSYIGLENLLSGGGIGSKATTQGVKSTKTVFSSGNVLYGRLRPYLDKHAVVDFSGVCSTDILAYHMSKHVDAEYFNFWISTKYFQNFAVSHSKGDLPRVSGDDIAVSPFPLAPLGEQKRMVEYLNDKFQQVDEAIEKLEEYLSQTGTRRLAVIQAGVSGGLTQEWRVQNSESREEWHVATLGESFEWASGGTPSRRVPEYYTGAIRWVKSGELLDDFLYDTEEHITKEAIENSSAKIFPKGSVAIAMYGATIGKTAILGQDAATNQAVAVAKNEKHTLGRFLLFYLIASREKFVSLGKGGAQPNISQKVIKSFPYERPSLAEQEQIVEILEGCIEKLDETSKKVKSTLEILRNFKQALIAESLSGKLTTGNAETDI